MSLLLLIVLLLLVFGGLPNWGYHNYGYAPSVRGRWTRRWPGCRPCIGLKLQSPCWISQPRFAIAFNFSTILSAVCFTLPTS
jgi:hypothetical protein